MSDELKQFNPEGYNPSTGIQAPNSTGDWEDELEALDYTAPERAVSDNSIVAF